MFDFNMLQTILICHQRATKQPLALPRPVLQLIGYYYSKIEVSQAAGILSDALGPRHQPLLPKTKEELANVTAEKTDLLEYLNKKVEVLNQKLTLNVSHIEQLPALAGYIGNWKKEKEAFPSRILSYFFAPKDGAGIHISDLKKSFAQLEKKVNLLWILSLMMRLEPADAFSISMEGVVRIPVHITSSQGLFEIRSSRDAYFNIKMTQTQCDDLISFLNKFFNDRQFCFAEVRTRFYGGDFAYFRYLVFPGLKRETDLINQLQALSIFANSRTTQKLEELRAPAASSSSSSRISPS